MTHWIQMMELEFSGNELAKFESLNLKFLSGHVEIIMGPDFELLNHNDIKKIIVFHIRTVYSDNCISQLIRSSSQRSLTKILSGLDGLEELVHELDFEGNDIKVLSRLLYAKVCDEDRPWCELFQFTLLDHIDDDGDDDIIKKITRIGF
ncbi:hypothetical protein Glove_300g31 [Diversispora epigaea]|uniref:Uncharacterized protein n=1 Tax=Diversispora epigaea TaxID=1348612 RepID=A0A397I2K3_9GLOM|nr:hypothetical protein Glove_300g31 [Diversispora epigaea]